MQTKAIWGTPHTCENGTCKRPEAAGPGEDMMKNEPS